MRSWRDSRGFNYQVAVTDRGGSAGEVVVLSTHVAFSKRQVAAGPAFVRAARHQEAIARAWISAIRKSG